MNQRWFAEGRGPAKILASDVFDHRNNRTPIKFVFAPADRGMPGQWINRPFSFHLLLRYRENYYRFWCHFFLFLFFATFNFLLCCPLNKFDSNLKFEYLLLSETYSLYFLKRDEWSRSNMDWKLLYTFFYSSWEISIFIIDKFRLILKFERKYSIVLNFPFYMHALNQIQVS